MILVVNLNASMDKRYEIADISKGKVIRARQVENTPGGKGIHVANVMTILDEKVYCNRIYWRQKRERSLKKN